MYYPNYLFSTEIGWYKCNLSCFNFTCISFLKILLFFMLDCNIRPFIKGKCHKCLFHFYLSEKFYLTPVQQKNSSRKCNICLIAPDDSLCSNQNFQKLILQMYSVHKKSPNYLKKILKTLSQKCKKFLPTTFLCIF